MRGERGITQLEFSFAPGFGSGTFFIYAEMKGKPPSSGVLRLERPRSERRTVALAAPEPRVSVTFEYAGRADSQQPPLRPFKYFFMLRASRALEADCEIRLTVERGPMEFLSEGGPTESLSPQKQVWILRGDETSASFMIVSKESADFTEQRPVRITAQPTAGCAQAAPAEQTFKVPPRIVRGVVFQPFVSRVPGNGRIPVILTVRVRDDLGSTPTPGRYGFESVLLQLQPQLSGRRFGWLAEIPGNPKLIRKDEPIEATWKLIGTGHFLVSVTARVRQGDVEEEFKSEVPLGFYFPYSLFLIGLIGAVPALIIRKRRRAVVAAIVSEVVVLGGFLGILREEFVVNSPVDISLVPWYFDVAVGVVALAIGSMIAFGSSLWRPLQGPGRTGCRTRRRDG